MVGVVCCKARKGVGRLRPSWITAQYQGDESHRFLHSSAVAKRRIKAREQARRIDKQPPPEADR
jgi:hypothetical protein